MPTSYNPFYKANATVVTVKANKKVDCEWMIPPGYGKVVKMGLY